MRLIFQMYPQFGEVISATVSRKSLEQAPAPLSRWALFQFSWSHFVELIRLDDAWKRAFYENECLKGNWSVLQPPRQSAFSERGHSCPRWRASVSTFCIAPPAALRYPVVLKAENVGSK